MTLPKEAILLMTQQGFIQLYFDNLKNCSTNIEAYEKAEEKYYEFFGKNRYASYDSFRISMAKKIKSRS